MPRGGEQGALSQRNQCAIGQRAVAGFGPGLGGGSGGSPVEQRVYKETLLSKVIRAPGVVGHNDRTAPNHRAPGAGVERGEGERGGGGDGVEDAE